MNLNEAIQTAIKEVKNEYAQSYLNAMMEAIERFGGDGLEAQILYALNNMQGWRGENAREAKKAMRDFVAQKQRERKAKKKVKK